MNKSITSILSVLALAFSLSAHAQFSGSVEQYPTTDWRSSYIEFDLSEVATAMGYASAADFANVFTASLRANEEKETFDGAIFFSAANPEGEQVSTYTAESGRLGCFWLNADGQVVAYGDPSVFFCLPSVESENDIPTKLVFALGQYPERCEANKTYSTVITMGNGTKSVTFNLSLKVNEMPVVEVNPVLSQLTIKGTTEIAVEQYPRGTYRADAVQFPMADAIKALDFPKAVLEADLRPCFYSYQLDVMTDLLNDTLSNKVTSSSGYWFSPSYDETTGATKDLCFIDTYSEANNYFFVEGFAYNSETDSATFNLGQCPSALKVGNTPYAELYLINGSNAWKFVVKLTIVPEPIADEVTEVYREYLVITKKPTANGNYDGKDYKIDEEKITELLGGDPSEWVFKHNNSDNHSTNYTTSATGFWMDVDGNICSWAGSIGAAAVYVDYSAPATLTIGQYPGKNKDGDVFHTILEVVNFDKAYTIDLTVNFSAGDGPIPFTNLATYEIEVQRTIPEVDYATVTTQPIDYETIFDLIGTNDPGIYTIAVPDSGETKITYSDSFTCTPYPGFWYNKEGQNAGWGANAFVGLTYSLSNGTYDVYLYPGATQVGDTFKTNWFFVNEETGAMVTIIINVLIVDEVVEREIVGSESTLVDIGDGEDESTATINLSEAIAKLEAADVADFYENGTLLAAVNSSSFGGADFYDEAEGFWFDSNGYVIDPSNEAQLETQTFSVNIFIENDGTATITTYCLVPPAEGQVYSTRLALNYGSKRYIITVQLATHDTALSISAVNSDNNNANVYDLSGRIVRKNANSVEGLNRGIYIQNGKKVFVK